MENRFSGFSIKFGEFPELLFTVSSDYSEYFDATGFIKSKGCMESRNVDGFMRTCKPWIDAFCQTYSLTLDKITIVAPSGHILIDSSLALLFVSYIDPEFGVYTYEKMADLLISGIILSDTTLMLMAKDRLSKAELLKLLEQNE